MKQTLLLTSILFGILLFTGCNNEENRIEQANQKEIDIYAPLGKQISGELLSTLKSKLVSAVKTGGPAHAISFCNVQAGALTDSVAAASKLKVEIKRTSFKYRNPENAPDKAEVLALKYFTQMADKDKVLPNEYLQRISEVGKNSYYYYKPLMVGNACLVCHGTSETISPEATALIQEKYPEDKAIGYNEGDFRGLVRVKFTEMGNNQ